jgi:mycofactocin precursor
MTGQIATAETTTNLTFNVTSDGPAARHADTPAPAQPAPSDPSPDVTIQDVLVEEVSIDGMCGVY